jgi:hypothetical protein
LPHAVSSVPPVHCVPKQQPPPQLSGPHVGLPVHWPPPPGLAVQAWPLLAQFWHCWPFAPHDVALVPVRHWLPTQQPLQFAELQLDCEHVRVLGSHRRP